MSRDRSATVRTAAATTAAVAVTGAVGSLATGPQTSWYRSLRKPRFQPPPITFPAVWTALYATIAAASTVAITRFRERGDDESARRYEQALGANLALNAGWPWLFFRARRPWLATAECAALAASSAGLAARAGRADRRAGLALAPYTLWCGFATVLSASIAWLNRDS